MRRALLLFIITLFLLFCSCSSIPDGGDGFLPIPGLSFGMSIEEAMEVLPRLEFVVEITPYTMAEDYPEGFFDTIPSFVKAPRVNIFRLENTKIYGKTATVYFRFMNMVFYSVDDKEYLHDNGLDRVYIKFSELTETDVDAIMEPMEAVFDFQYPRYFGPNDFLSKSQVVNLDEKTLEVLKNYWANLPLTLDSDTQQGHHDYSFVIDAALGMDFPIIKGSNDQQIFIDYSIVIDALLDPDPNSFRHNMWKNQFQYFVWGHFNPIVGEMELEGINASILHHALQQTR